jgi:ERF superfamily
VKVYQAIAAVMSDLSKIGIGKEKTNQQQNFKYRGVDDVMNALAPLLAKHGLLILPRVMKREIAERVSSQGKPLFFTTLEIEYDFLSAEDGSKHVVGPIIGEAMDSGDKSANKAMAIAYKYVCFQGFCIPTEAAADPDAETHETLSPAQALGKRFVMALEVGIDDAVYDVWEVARADPQTYKAAWKLLTKSERELVNACIERCKQGREAA